MPILMARDGSPVPSKLTVGVVLELVAVPTYEDGSLGEPTTDAVWRLVPAGNGSIVKGRLVLDVPGTVTVTAVVGGVVSDPVTILGVQELDALTVTAAPRDGGQTITVTPLAADDVMRLYKVDAQPVSVEYGQHCSIANGWTPLPSTGEVKGVADQTVTVVDASLNGFYAHAAGSAVLPAASDVTGFVYYGVADSGLNGLDLSSLTKERREGAAGDYKYTPDPSHNDGDGQHLLFILPATWSEPKFSTAGFLAPFIDAGDTVIDSISYTVWVSKNPMTMPVTITVA